jgi:DNA replication and repair protein RecF
MYLTHLSLTDFRAFQRLDMDVPRQILILLGNNAQGKTSLLEAVYYLSTFTSFQAQSGRQLINFMASNQDLSVARLVAEYERNDGPHNIEVRLIQDHNPNGMKRIRKEILLDGVKRKIHEAFGHFNAVIFMPQMTHILEGSPEERRRYLNLTLSQAVPGYAHALSEYNQVLTQRNALLKQLSERGSNPDQIDYWDNLLTNRGAYIIHQRIKAIHELEQFATRIHHRLSASKEVLRFSYQPSYDPIPQSKEQYALPLQTPIQRIGFTQEEIRLGFERHLQEIRSEEIARGLTIIGPHRDDLRFLSNQIDLGDYGSRGQIRTALMALKLAEVSWLKAKTGETPVLLLDEIMAELDIGRRSDLLSYLESCEQALLTTTDKGLFSEEFINHSTMWWVEEGRVKLTA